MPDVHVGAPLASDLREPLREPILEQLLHEAGGDVVSQNLLTDRAGRFVHSRRPFTSALTELLFLDLVANEPITISAAAIVRVSQTQR